jgi:hypothetical protein
MCRMDFLVANPHLNCHRIDDETQLPSSESHHEVPVRALVGGIVGGLVAVSAILLLIIRRHLRDRGNANRADNEVPMLDPEGLRSQSELGGRLEDPPRSERLALRGQALDLRHSTFTAFRDQYNYRCIIG